MNKDNIHVQSRAVILKEGHILLCKTTGLDPDFYFLPGGHIEHGESAKHTMLRELKEEIGFEFEIIRFLGCFEYSFDPNIIKHAKCHTHEYNFIFEATSNLLPAPHIALEQFEKHIKILWIPNDELETIDLRPDPLKNFIPKWLNLNMNSAFESKMVRNEKSDGNQNVSYD